MGAARSSGGGLGLQRSRLGELLHIGGGSSSSGLQVQQLGGRHSWSLAAEDGNADDVGGLDLPFSPEKPASGHLQCGGLLPWLPPDRSDAAIEQLFPSAPASRYGGPLEQAAGSPQIGWQQGILAAAAVTGGRQAEEAGDVEARLFRAKRRKCSGSFGGDGGTSFAAATANGSGLWDLGTSDEEEAGTFPSLPPV